MGKVKHINPKMLHKNPAFTNVIIVDNPHTTVHIGGQNAVNKDGEIIGKGDLIAQTKQALMNIKNAIESVGGELKNIVKWTVYVVSGQKPEKNHAAYLEFRNLWGNVEKNPPPLISMIFVAGLAHPDFLVEIEAIGII